MQPTRYPTKAPTQKPTDITEKWQPFKDVLEAAGTNPFVWNDIKPTKEDTQYHLENLKEFILAAGMGIGKVSSDERETEQGKIMYEQYTAEARRNFSEMHFSGHTWPLNKLTNIFKQGLFNAYIYLILGFQHSPAAAYIPLHDQLDLLQIRKQKTAQIQLQNKYRLTSGKYVPFDDLIQLLSNVTEQLKRNEELMTIGGLFQKNKVITEKLQTKLERANSANLDETVREQIFKEMMTQDAITRDQQLIIYYWIDNVYNELCDILRSNNASWSIGLREGWNDDFDLWFSSLPRFRPQFLMHYYWASVSQYQRRTDDLEQITKPTQRNPWDF